MASLELGLPVAEELRKVLKGQNNAASFSEHRVQRGLLHEAWDLTNERDFLVPGRPRCGIGQLRATMGIPKYHQPIQEGKSITILTAGIDLAKNVFAVHGVI